MNRATFLALAARCEATIGSDRQLDVEIAVAITPGCVGIERQPLDGQPNDWLMVWHQPRKWSDSWLKVETFTSNIDDAALLVPEKVRAATIVALGGRAMVPHPNGYGHDFVGNAATPALALCAAGLRAQASTMEEAPC